MTVLRMYFTVRAIKNFIVKNWIFERLVKVIIPKISVGKIFGENPRRNIFPTKFLVVNVSNNIYIPQLFHCVPFTLFMFACVKHCIID